MLKLVVIYSSFYACEYIWKYLRIHAFVMFLGISKLPSTGLVPAYVLPAMYEIAYFPTTWPTQYVLDFCHSNESEK